ncbi:MAG: DUF6089 family protein [Bacteroidota bacterium]
MKHLCLIIFSVLCFGTAKAQYAWDVGGTLGATNYLGDIGGGAGTGRKFISDMKLAKTRWNVGGFVRYKMNPKGALRFAVDYIRLEGDDKLSLNPSRRFRNFNFRNDIYDFGLTYHYTLFENNDIGRTYRFKNSFKLYAFAGLGGFYSNPKTLYKGIWVPLQPLATEGVKYKHYVLDIPMGVGAYFTIHKRHRLGVELNYRKTFTDYLDDISGDYPQDPGNEYMRGLIIRKDELSAADIAANPEAYAAHNWGYKRGEKKNKDAFMALNVSYSYVIKGRYNFQTRKNTGYFSKNRKIRRTKKRY